MESQNDDHASILNLYRRLIEVRRTTPALTTGNYKPMVATGDVLLFCRELAGHKPVLIALNLGDSPAAAMVTNKEMVGRVVVSAFGDREGEVIDGSIDLRPNEGLVVQLS